MYDICKNNQRVAKLHLIKTAHRLGEPVIGVLDFSEAVLSTYKVSSHQLNCFIYYHFADFLFTRPRYPYF